MLGAIASSPALKPLAKLVPETYTTYLVGTDAFVSYNVRYTFGPRPGQILRVRNITPQPFLIYGKKPE
jgi:hypothetical protein